ncbi:unnamed protein product [Protopolystoma xenopodis]|uniref:Uncharacterized protein n=1 Tax=Protopolystoma xenopodis TaxID=117903 RepID=A0A448WNX0_9PLAT|nr:unnamed protein product [Protopolystoma xenopodis]
MQNVERVRGATFVINCTVYGDNEGLVAKWSYRARESDAWFKIDGPCFTSSSSSGLDGSAAAGNSGSMTNAEFQEHGSGYDDEPSPAVTAANGASRGHAEDLDYDDDRPRLHSDCEDFVREGNPHPTTPSIRKVRLTSSSQAASFNLLGLP